MSPIAHKRLENAFILTLGITAFLLVLFGGFLMFLGPILVALGKVSVLFPFYGTLGCLSGIALLWFIDRY